MHQQLGVQTHGVQRPIGDGVCAPGARRSPHSVTQPPAPSVDTPLASQFARSRGIMIRVFVWPFRGSKVAWGHAAVEVSGGEPSGSVYISWWPQGVGRRYKAIHDNLYCVAAIPNRTFADDVAGEDGMQPAETILIEGAGRGRPGLDESAIKAWWNSLRGRGFTDWCTLGPNCSTVAAYALAKGGGDRFSNVWRDARWVWSPPSVAYYARSIAEGIRSARLGSSSYAQQELDGGVPAGGVP